MNGITVDGTPVVADPMVPEFTYFIMPRFWAKRLKRHRQPGNKYRRKFKGTFVEAMSMEINHMMRNLERLMCWQVYGDGSTYQRKRPNLRRGKGR